MFQLIYGKSICQETTNYFKNVLCKVNVTVLLTFSYASNENKERSK